MIKLLVGSIIGYLGMGLLLLALYLSRKHFFKSQIVSIVGGILLAINACYINAWPFFMLNSFWAILSIYNLFKHRRDKLAGKRN